MSPIDQRFVDPPFRTKPIDALTRREVFVETVTGWTRMHRWIRRGMHSWQEQYWDKDVKRG